MSPEPFAGVFAKPCRPTVRASGARRQAVSIVCCRGSEASLSICGCLSQSRHSCYWRCLQDLPWQGLSVQLYMLAHRYRRRNPGCPRKIFCERLPGVARRYARQTDRTSEIVRVVGYIAGGKPGQRLLLRLAIGTSDHTVLRRVKQPPAESVEATTIRNLGVDDWAWRKGQNYGTILVDLDLHRVADLLPDRSSESFACWLQQHRGMLQ